MVRPGDVLLSEDNLGTGHKWRLTNESQPWRRRGMWSCKPSAKGFRFVANTFGG